MDKRLLDILVCPATKGKLVLKGVDSPTGIELLSQSNAAEAVSNTLSDSRNDADHDISKASSAVDNARTLTADEHHGDGLEQGSTVETEERSARVELELWSRSAGLAYPVIDGIPRMVESEARALSNEEIASLKESRK